MKVSPKPQLERRVRADAQRNLDSLLETAKEVFAKLGVDAPVREIANRAGVGIATLYRHFPQRSDLVAAVYRREIDACVDAAPALVREHEPVEALRRWLHRYMGFIDTKRGLVEAYRAGVPVFEALPAYFREHLEPVLQSLLDAAVAAREIRADIKAYELLRSVSNLCKSDPDVGPNHGRRMVDVLIDGLRYRAASGRRPLKAQASGRRRKR